MTPSFRENADSRKLSLLDACAMAVGGMVGGGIFAVLGTVALSAGNAAFLAFGLAGLLALVTGLSYARLTVDFDEAGESFSYVEHIVGPRTAGTVSWFLLLGYLFTVNLYAFTFGAYTARLLGLGEASAPLLGAVVILLLSGLNLVGVRESGLVEDVLVFGKMIVLVVVAYEGFQLLAYDYEDVEDHRRNLPRAVWVSIPVVIVTYMVVAFVTTGALPDETIARHGSEAGSPRTVSSLPCSPAGPAAACPCSSSASWLWGRSSSRRRDRWSGSRPSRAWSSWSSSRW